MSSPILFDRRQIRRQRDRSAARLPEHAFLFDWTIEALTDRLDLIKRKFPQMLQLGGRPALAMSQKLAQAAGAERTVIMDCISPSPRPSPDGRGRDPCKARVGEGQIFNITADEEALPLAPQTFDLIVSPLTLHTVNDLPGALIQIRRSLKPDGLFLAAIPGGETLYQLRDVLMQAELSLKGGVSPRVAPFADKQQMGALMQRAGFALPVVDSDIITVTYENIFRLMADLRGMGEGNAVAARSRTFASRALWAEAARLYAEKYAEADGRLPAAFEIIFLIGWAPHASQQKPLRPGSAQKSLADALGTQEIGVGEKARPQPAKQAASSFDDPDRQE